MLIYLIILICIKKEKFIDYNYYGYPRHPYEMRFYKYPYFY